MAVQRCKLRTRMIPCYTPEGLAISAEWFGYSEGEIAKRAGRFTRGAHKGQVRGWLFLHICSEGGWKRDGSGEGGGVILPGTIYASFYATWDELSKAQMNPFNGGQVVIARKWPSSRRTPEQLRDDVESLGIPCAGLEEAAVLELWATFTPADMRPVYRREDKNGNPLPGPTPPGKDQARQFREIVEEATRVSAEGRDTYVFYASATEQSWGFEPTVPTPTAVMVAHFKNGVIVPGPIVAPAPAAQGGGQ